MEIAKRRAGIVDDGVAAACFHALLAREQRDIELHVGDRGLLERFVAQILLLIVGELRLAHVLRAIFVEHVHVVIEVAAGGGRADHADGGDQPRHARQPRGQPLQPRHQRHLRAAPPQQMGEHRQHQRERAPIEPQPPRRRAADIVAIHVRIADIAGRAVIVERVIKADIGKGDRADDVDHHHAPADIFVGAERLHQDRQHRQDHRVGRGGQQQPHHIFAELQIGDAARELDEDRRRNGDRVAREQHRDQRQRLGRQIGPVGQRGRVDDLVHLAVAVAPHQLAGIIDGDDERDDPERAEQRLDRGEGERPGWRAVKLGRKDQRRTRIEQADQHQHEKGRTLENLRHLEADTREQPGHRRVARAHRRQRVDQHRRRGGELRLAPGKPGELALRHAALGKGEAGIGKDERDQRHTHPDRTIGEQHAVERRDGGVRLGRGPVAGRAADSRRAERLDIAGDVAQLGPAAQRRQCRQIQHQKQDDADIAVHHRPRQRGDREEDRRGEQDVGQRDDEIAERVIADHVRPQRLLIDPGHQRAEEHRQRHRHEGEPGGEIGAHEPPDQIIALRHPRRADDLGKAAVIVAQHHIGDERGRHEHEEQREDEVILKDRDRRVAVDIAAAADLDLLDRHAAKGEQEEQHRDHPEDRVAQLVTQLEGGDLREHGRVPSRALMPPRARGGCARAWRNTHLRARRRRGRSRRPDRHRPAHG